MTKEAAKERILKEFNKLDWSVIEVSEIVRAIFPEHYVAPEHGTVMEYAAEACGIKPAEVFENSRAQKTVLARKLVFLELRRQGFTFQSIGSKTGKDHATVMYGIRTLKNDIKYGHPLTVSAHDKFKQLIDYGK